MSLWRRAADYTSAADIRELSRRVRATWGPDDVLRSYDGYPFPYIDRAFVYGLRGMSVLAAPAAAYLFAIHKPGLALATGAVGMFFGVDSVLAAEVHRRTIEAYEKWVNNYEEQFGQGRSTQ